MTTIKKFPRHSLANQIVIQEKGLIFTFPMDDFLQKNKIEGVIRIQKEDYIFLHKELQYFTHFNLQWTNHRSGLIYALPLIVKPGYYTDEKEVLPILSFENCLIAKCLEVREYLNYEEITSEDFKFSLPTIQNIEELKKALIKRYSQSLPSFPTEKLLSLGVVITKMKIMGTWEKYTSH